MARILIANDNPAVRAYLQRSLTRAGHGVVLVDNGHDALMAMYQAPFDLLLTDVGIAGIDGVQLARHVAYERPDVQVMLITGFSAVALTFSKSPATKSATKKAPTVSRPFHLRELAQHVDVVLSA